MTSPILATSTFHPFPLLPLEIRLKIWTLSLPGPRILLVSRSSSSPSSTQPKTLPASYSRLPSLLSTNSESRALALQHFTPRFGTYWNLEIDAPYFEITYRADKNVTLFAELARSGGLDGFKHVALDLALWSWTKEGDSMEWKVCFRRGEWDAWEHPLESIARLKDLETCTFIHTLHTIQPTIHNPSSPAWTIGPLTAATTLDPNFEQVETLALMRIATLREIRKRDTTKSELVAGGPYNWMMAEKKIPKLKGGENVKIGLGAIWGRERGVLPEGVGLYRVPCEGWELDWFG